MDLSSVAIILPVQIMTSILLVIARQDSKTTLNLKVVLIRMSALKEVTNANWTVNTVLIQ